MVNNADFAIRVVSPKLLLPEADVRTLYIAGAVEVLKHSNVDLVLNPEVKEDETKPFTKVSQSRVSYVRIKLITLFARSVAATARCKFQRGLSCVIPY
jgi:hypothetical protein